MLIEVSGALVAGFVSASFALIAFGSDSAVELVSAFVVLNHVRLDKQGSSTQGERTALFTTLLLLLLVPLIGSTSSYFFFVLKTEPVPSLLGVIIASGAAGIMPVLWLNKKDIGRRTGCLPLSIDATESATCFFMSVALLASLVSEYLFHVGWTDYVATLGILGFIGYEVIESFELTKTKVSHAFRH